MGVKLPTLLCIRAGVGMGWFRHLLRRVEPTFTLLQCRSMFIPEPRASARARGRDRAKARAEEWAVFFMCLVVVVSGEWWS